jgi:hypothetical protein
MAAQHRAAVEERRDRLEFPASSSHYYQLRRAGPLPLHEFPPHLQDEEVVLAWLDRAANHEIGQPGQGEVRLAGILPRGGVRALPCAARESRSSRYGGAGHDECRPGRLGGRAAAVRSHRFPICVAPIPVAPIFATAISIGRTSWMKKTARTSRRSSRAELAGRPKGGTG